MGITVSLKEANALRRGQLRDYAYNTLDCTGTRAVADVLLPRLTPQTGLTYSFERACQAPALAMMIRGVLVNLVVRDSELAELRRDLKKAAKASNKQPLIKEKWDGTELETGKCKNSTRKDGRHKWPRGVPDAERRCETCNTPRVKRKDFNPNSHVQCWHLFYDILGIPVQKNKKGEESTDEFVLEKIARRWKQYAGLVDTILAVRGIKKQIGFVNSRLSSDGRFMSSFNVGAAWTGRWSSSKNPYREGSNLQNISERHRRMFMADPGKEMCYADLEQAESRTVAYDAEDEAYIKAHLSGDVHTYVCRMLWPDLDWTGDLTKDKVVAKANPPWDLAPGHTWRFAAKRCQHGLNYGLSPQGIAAWAHIPLAEAKLVYERYFTEFAGVYGWQRAIAKMVKDQQALVNPLGRRCRLFGRPWDAHTYRQGLSFIPQSTVGDVLNLSLWGVWKNCDPQLIQLLGQVHDAILCEFDIEARDEAVVALTEHMTIPIPIKGRTMTIPVEIAIGRNWGHRQADPDKPGYNPNGIEAL